MSGQNISPEESNEILKTIEDLQPEILVASGSLLPNIGDDFYEKVAYISRKIHAKLVIDTSGEALKRAVDEGVFLLKPNIGELAKLVEVESLEMNEVDDAAQLLIEKGGCQIVVVSLGPQGAMLVTKNSVEMLSAPPVQKKSTVGAGDSMVGGMVWAISENKNLAETLRWGVACGSAATMNEGTQLFKATDAQKLFDWLCQKYPIK
jgi:6-phosphofructokinase 2